MSKILILTVLSIALVGCQSWPNPPLQKWDMYRFDKNYNPQKVTP